MKLHADDRNRYRAVIGLGDIRILDRTINELIPSEFIIQFSLMADRCIYLLIYFVYLELNTAVMANSGFDI